MKLTLSVLMLALAGGAYAVGHHVGYSKGYVAAMNFSFKYAEDLVQWKKYANEPFCTYNPDHRSTPCLPKDPIWLDWTPQIKGLK